MHDHPGSPARLGGFGVMVQAELLPSPVPKQVEPRCRAGVMLAMASETRRRELTAALAARGVRVWSAATGLEALSTFFDHTGDVALFVAEIGLPDLPGTELVQRLKIHFPGVPCVVLADLAGQAV